MDRLLMNYERKWKYGITYDRVDVIGCMVTYAEYCWFCTILISGSLLPEEPHVQIFVWKVFLVHWKDCVNTC